MYSTFNFWNVKMEELQSETHLLVNFSKFTVIMQYVDFYSDFVPFMSCLQSHSTIRQWTGS